MSSRLSWGNFCYNTQQSETDLAFDRLPLAVQETWQRSAQAVFLLLDERIQFLEETIQNDPDLDPENVEFTVALLALVQTILSELPRDSDASRCKALLEIRTPASSPFRATEAKSSEPRVGSTCRESNSLTCTSCSVSPMAHTTPPPP